VNERVDISLYDRSKKLATVRVPAAMDWRPFTEFVARCLGVAAVLLYKDEQQWQYPTLQFMFAHGEEHKLFVKAVTEADGQGVIVPVVDGDRTQDVVVPRHSKFADLRRKINLQGACLVLRDGVLQVANDEMTVGERAKVFVTDVPDQENIAFALAADVGAGGWLVPVGVPMCVTAGGAVRERVAAAFGEDPAKVKCFRGERWVEFVPGMAVTEVNKGQTVYVVLPGARRMDMERRDEGGIRIGN
jgi:hypothetical protein